MGHKTPSLPSLIGQSLKNQKIRFGLVGVANTAVDFIVLFSLVFFAAFPSAIANIFSTGCALALSYILNKRMVFGSKEPTSRSQIFLFIGGTLFGLWILQSVVILAVDGLAHAFAPSFDTAITLMVAKILATIVSLIWNYIWYSRVVFVKQSIKPEKIMQVLAGNWRLVVTGASIVSLVLALVLGFGRSIWFDEGYSIMLAQRPVSEMMELTKADAHPPLYYLYLKGWGSTFGWSELSLRLSSAIPAALTVGFMLLVVRRLFNVRTMLVATPFLVAAPFLLRYAFEIRMYALVALIGVTATWLLLKARESKDKKWWFAYALTVALGMYTLYMSIVIWIGHALWLVYCDLKDGRKNVFVRQHWLYYLLAVGVFLPWLPILYNQLVNSALPPNMSHLDDQSFANLVTLVITYTASWNVQPWLGGAIIAAVLLACWLLWHIRQKAQKQWRNVALLLIMFIAALMFYWAISTPPNPPRFVERYMLHVSPYFYALVGVIAYLAYVIGKRWQSVAFALLSLSLFVYGVVSLNENGNYNYQRLQATYAKTIKHDVGCGETAFVTSGAYGYIDMWYDFQGCDFRFFQPVDLTYIGGYAPLNPLMSTAERVKDSQSLDTKRIAFIYFDDSTEFMQVDSRYMLERTIDYGGAHVQIYERVP